MWCVSDYRGKGGANHPLCGKVSQLGMYIAKTRISYVPLTQFVQEAFFENLGTCFGM